MKKTITVLTMALLAANVTHATESVPMLINLQSVVVDNGGNRLSDLTQVAEFDFWIKDADGNILFEERQELPVVKGAISALVGESTTGGIPIEALAPDGDRILEFKLVDDSISQETTQIISVPYSYFAEAIAGGVNTEDINDGQVGLEDLNDEVLAILNTDETGEPTTTLDASEVTFSAAIASGTGTNMEALMESVDHTIVVHDDRMDMIEDSVDAVEATAADLQTQIDTEETARAAADTVLQSNIDTEEAARQAADTTLTTAVTTAQTTANTANTAAAAAQTTANSASTAAAAAQADADAAQSDAAAAQATADTKVSKSGDIVTGDIQTNDPSSCSATLGDDAYTDDADCLQFDGVDVSELKDRVTIIANNHPDSEPRTIAMARVDASGSTPDFDQSYSFSSITKNPTYDIDGDGDTESSNDCTYQLDFSSSVSVTSGTSYIVIGNLQESEGDNGLVIRETTSEHIIVSTVDMGDDSTGCEENTDFHLLVTGY